MTPYKPRSEEEKCAHCARVGSAQRMWEFVHSPEQWYSLGSCQRSLDQHIRGRKVCGGIGDWGTRSS